MLRQDLHSTLVAWLKVLLPLAALAILSTLFLVARDINPDAAIPFAEVDVDDRAREPRLTRPTWSGTTADGASLTVRAAEARPGAASGEGPSATATAVTATLETPGGGRTQIDAAAVAIDEAAGQARLSGDVVVVTSTGYRMETQVLTVRLDRTGAESDGPVAGTGPAGRIDAGGLRITRDATAPDRYLLVFDKGVQLVYDPPP